MNRAKTGTINAKCHRMSPQYLRVQFSDRPVPKTYFPFWVKPRFITKKTGFDKYDLRRAREQGTINYKTDEDGEYLYDINSLPERFFIREEKKHA